jgi:hypothetical protein
LSRAPHLSHGQLQSTKFCKLQVGVCTERVMGIIGFDGKGKWRWITWDWSGAYGESFEGYG